MTLPTDLRSALDDAAATPRLLVVSDFDGTLSPIVTDPSTARALPAAAAALTALAALPDTTVALVSGRALAVLRDLTGADLPPTVHLVGSHGAEFDAGFADLVDTELLARIVAELREIAADLPGVTVETKPASAALHVRNASAADGERALAAARRAAERWGAHETAGKAVLEFAVVDTDKGAALEALREQSAATAVVFLGDDVTDEKAFRRLRDGDVGVKVGPGESLARYRVDDPDDVAAALDRIAAARR